MSRVLIASITQLCAADHDGDPERIAAWTANKTPEMVGRMLTTYSMFVALRGEAVVAVGLIRGSEIGLNYVDPGHRFAGVSKALLTHMEAELRARGFDRGTLTSTATALEFYRAAGWRETAPGAPGTGYPMEKEL